MNLSSKLGTRSFILLLSFTIICTSAYRKLKCTIPLAKVPCQLSLLTNDDFSFRYSYNLEASSYDPNTPSVREPDPTITLATKLWIERVVVAYGLCPWAAGVYINNRLKILPIDSGLSRTQLKQAILLEARRLILGKSHYESILIVLPQITGFRQFLEFVNSMETLLKQKKFDLAIQLATFHPDYVFDRTHPNDPENYTNRSPYPIVHILRVDDVTSAIDSYHGSTDDIWKRNIATMNSLGIKTVQKTLLDIYDDAKRANFTMSKNENH